MKGGCFIETVKIEARLFHFMKIILSRRQTCRRSGKEFRTRLAERETSHGIGVAEAPAQRRHSKGLRSENIFLDHGRKDRRCYKENTAQCNSLLFHHLNKPVSHSSHI